MSKEIRSLTEKVEIRKHDDGNYIEGYAIVFNRESQNLGGFVEVIDPEAIDGADLSDIMGRYNHEMLIARSTSGTLTYEIDERGLKYRIKLPNSPNGENVRELVERGDVTGSSFAFSVRKNGQVWEERKDDVPLRRITGFEGVYDVGPVDTPAYLDTTAAKRSLEEATKQTEEVESKGLESKEGKHTTEIKPNADLSGEADKVTVELKEKEEKETYLAKIKILKSI